MGGGGGGGKGGAVGGVRGPVHRAVHGPGVSVFGSPTRKYRWCLVSFTISHFDYFQTEE